MSDALPSPLLSDNDLNNQVRLLLKREKELSATKLQLEHIIARNLILQQIGQFLITNQVMADGLRYATRALVVEMSFEKSFLVLRTGESLAVTVSCGYSREQEQALASLGPDKLEAMFAVITAADGGEFVDTPGQRAKFGQPLLDTLSLLTFLCAPLRQGDDIIGFLVAGFSTEQEASYRENLLLSNQDSLWFSALANQMSSMIVNAQLIASLQERTNKLNALSGELAKANQDLEKKVQDRTEQLRHNVSELMLAKAKDEAVFASMGEGLIITGLDGIVLLVNHIAESIFELADGEAVGKPFSDVVRLGNEQGMRTSEGTNSVAQAMQQGRNSVQTRSFVKKDGKTIFVGVTVTPIVQQTASETASRTIGSIAIVRDITKEKEVDRMKTEFISLASHQLRTPLSAIKWFSEMLLNGDAGELTPEQLEFAGNIAGSAERMIELVNSLLNISRIESGRIIVDPEPTNLEELVQGIINDLRGKIEERHHNLVVSVHGELPKINLDPHLVGQIYLNLLTNAIKYTPDGGEISVFISRQNDQVISQITDNGYGIPKAEQGKLFQKFFRATNAVKLETDGTGLGMYLLKAIVESSGGKIWFESEEGKGSTFWFSLPMSGMQRKEGEVVLEAATA